MHQKKLELNLSSTFKDLDDAVETLQDFVPTLDLDDDLAYRVILLASEALTNAMEHGNQWNQTKKAILRLVKEENQVELTVTDEGDGIYWTQRNPLTEANRMADHGRGQYFMQTMADEVHVEDHGRGLRLVFYCQT